MIIQGASAARPARESRQNDPRALRRDCVDTLRALAAARGDAQNRLASGDAHDMIAPYTSFRDFYPFYLSEHRDPICRRLHFAGSTLVLIVLVVACVSQRWSVLWLLPLLGYGFAWVGHFFFEHNRPATFRYPLYSFAGDWVMYWQIVTGRIPL